MKFNFGIPRKPVAPQAETEAHKENKSRNMKSRADRMNSKIKQRKKELGEETE